MRRPFSALGGLSPRRQTPGTRARKAGEKAGETCSIPAFCRSEASTVVAAKDVGPPEGGEVPAPIESTEAANRTCDRSTAEGPASRMVWQHARNRPCDDRDGRRGDPDRSRRSVRHRACRQARFSPTTQPHAESEGTASGSQRTIALAPEPAATRNTSTTDRSTRTSPAVERIKPSAAAAATTPSRPRTDYRPTASRSKPATPESITTDAENAEVVTITGCLHLDQQTSRSRMCRDRRCRSPGAGDSGSQEEARLQHRRDRRREQPAAAESPGGARGRDGNARGPQAPARSLRTVSGSCRDRLCPAGLDSRRPGCDGSHP